jgi:acyl CoA:acetate/3-ketoacid CoA transferase
MGFMPIVGSIKEMDKRIFNDGKMGIRDDIVKILFNA